MQKPHRRLNPLYDLAGQTKQQPSKLANAQTYSALHCLFDAHSSEAFKAWGMRKMEYNESIVSKRQENVYAFIDSQNVNLGVRSLGWRLDYKKLRLYLKNKYNVTQAYLFIGMIPNNQDLYTQLQKAGFILIFKPTIRYIKDGKETVKGNVDAELVLHASAIEFDKYDKAIIMSGDGDFACLIDFLLQKGKLLHIFVPNRKYSKLLSEYAQYIVRLDYLKKSLALKKTSIGGRSKP